MQQLPYFFMLVASIILLICSVGSVKNEAYAISVAVIAMIGSLCALVMTYKMEETWKRVGPVSSNSCVYSLVLWGSFWPIVWLSKKKKRLTHISVFDFLTTRLLFSVYWLLFAIVEYHWGLYFDL